MNDEKDKADKEKRAAKRAACYQRNKQRELEQARKYRPANKEKIQARRKTYYQANKQKFADYQQENRTRITERNRKRLQDNPELIEKKRKYSQTYYQENRESALLAAKQYRTENKDKVAEGRRQYYSKNRDILVQNMAQYYQQTKRTQKEMATTVGIKEAAAILGVAYSKVQRMVTSGTLPARRVGRSVLINKSDLEAARVVSTNIVNGFAVPKGFDLITTYEELTDYTKSFAAGRINFLLLVGSPGSGKSRQMKSDLDGEDCKWISNHASNLGLYCSVYEANNRPVVLDDVNHFLDNKVALSLIKALTQTDEEKQVSWESTTKALDQRDVPREYVTKSPICLIANRWDCANADFSAIQDRALPVAFYPNAETIHNRVIELGWCDHDIVEFIGNNLESIAEPSQREYFAAVTFKRAGMDWKQKMLSVWHGAKPTD